MSQMPQIYRNSVNNRAEGVTFLFEECHRKYRFYCKKCQQTPYLSEKMGVTKFKTNFVTPIVKFLNLVHQNIKKMKNLPGVFILFKYLVVKVQLIIAVHYVKPRFLFPVNEHNELKLFYV